MKKILKWIGITLTALVVVMVGFATFGLQAAINLTLQPVDLTTIADGTYSGEYNSGRFTNSVNVVIKDHAITAIEPVKIALGGNQLTHELTASVIAQQQPNVDAVAGATASSNSFLKAIETALVNASAQ